MTLYIQYTEDGTIGAVVQSSGPNPEHPRQLAVDESTVWDGMRVDLDTLTLIPCPVIAKNRHNQAIFNQLNAIDAGTIRALRDFHLKGDSASLQTLEDKAAQLRSQIIS